MTTAKQQAWMDDITERMDANLDEIFKDAIASGSTEDEAYSIISAIARGIAHQTNGFSAHEYISYLGYTKRLSTVEARTYTLMGGREDICFRTDGRDCPYIITTDQTRARREAKLAAMPPAKKIPAYLRHRK